MLNLSSEGVVVCPDCGISNSISTNSISQNARIACSHCRADLGPWQDIKKSALGWEPDGEQPVLR